MKKPTVTIYASGITPQQAIVKIYNGTNWIEATGWLYNNTWYYIDEPSLSSYLLDASNNYILDSSGNYIIVKGV